MDPDSVLSRGYHETVLQVLTSRSAKKEKRKTLCCVQGPINGVLSAAIHHCTFDANCWYKEYLFGYQEYLFSLILHTIL